MPQVMNALANFFRANVDLLLAEANRKKLSGLKDAVTQCISAEYERSALLKVLITGCEVLRAISRPLLIQCIADIGKLASMRMLPLPLAQSIPLASQTLRRLFDQNDDDVQLRVVQSLIAIVSTCDVSQAYVEQPLSGIFSLFISTHSPIVQAACSATITQTSHQVLNLFRATSGSTASPSTTGAQSDDVNAQLVAVSYYKDVCAMCAGITPKWIKLESSSNHALSIPLSLKHVLLDVLTQHLVEGGSVDCKTSSPLLIQCLNEDLVTLILTCPIGSENETTSSLGGGGGGPPVNAPAMSQQAFSEVTDLFTRVQRLGVAALVYAHEAMRHTAPAILNHHTMLICDAAAFPWKMAIVLSLWRKQLTDFSVFEAVLGVGRQTSDGGEMSDLSSATDTTKTTTMDDSSLSLTSSGMVLDDHHDQPPPLILLVQSAASLLNHIITSSCSSPSDGVESAVGRIGEIHVPSAASPERTAAASGGTLMSDHQQAAISLTHNGSFSTLTNAADILLLDGNTNASGTFAAGAPSIGVFNTKGCHEAHPAVEFVGVLLDFITMIAQSLSRSLDVACHGAPPQQQQQQLHRDADGAAAGWSGSTSQHIHQRVVMSLCPRLMQCCSLAMQHVVGEDIVHSVLKCTTHLLQCCCMLKLDSHRDRLLTVLAQQVLCAAPAAVSGGGAGGSSTSRETSPVQDDPPPPPTTTIPSQSPSRDRSGLNGSGSSRPPLAKHHSHTTRGGHAFTNNGSQNFIKDFLSNTEWMERRVHVLGSVISIASAMGSMLGRGWSIVVMCFLACGELLDELPRWKLRAVAQARGELPNVSVSDWPSSGPTKSSLTTSSNATTGWSDFMSQGAAQFLALTSNNHSNHTNTESGPQRGQPHPLPNLSAAAAGPSMPAGHAGASPPSSASSSELQGVLDSLLPMQEAIRHLYRNSTVLSDDALVHLVRATLNCSLPPTSPKNASFSFSVASAVFASRCIALLVQAHAAHEQCSQRLPTVVSLIQSFYERVLTQSLQWIHNNNKNNDMVHRSSGGELIANGNGVHSSVVVSVDHVAAFIDDLVQIGIHLLSSPLPQLSSSSSATSNAPTTTTSSVNTSLCVFPLQIMRMVYGISKSTDVIASSGSSLSMCILRNINLLSQSVSQPLPCAAWQLILRILGDAAEKSAEDVMYSFRCLETIQHGHIIGFDVETMRILLEAGCRFVVQRVASDKVSVNLSAVQLLWSVADYVVMEGSHSSGKVNCQNVALWPNLLSAMEEGCFETRQEVRQAAIKSLFSLAVTHGQHLPAAAFWYPFLNGNLRGLMRVLRESTQLRHQHTLAQRPSGTPTGEHSTTHSLFATMMTTPSPTHRGEEPLSSAAEEGDVASSSDRLARVVQHLASHAQQFDETRILLLDTIGRVFRVHYKTILNPISTTTTNNPNIVNAASSTSAVARELLGEFFSLCNCCLHNDTWGSSGSPEGLPEEVAVATVKTLHAVSNELLPGGYMDPQEVESVWSNLEELALAVGSFAPAANPQQNTAVQMQGSTLVFTSNVVSLVVETVGELVLGAISRRRPVSLSPSVSSGSFGSKAASALSAATWYPSTFTSTYLQRLGGMLEAASKSEAALVSYYYPSKVQQAVLHVVKMVFQSSNQLVESEWHTFCSFLLGQLPSRSAIERLVLSRAVVRCDSQSLPTSSITPGKLKTSTADSLPPLGVHLSYVAQVVRLLVDAMTLCPPSVAVWLSPVILRPVGYLLALELEVIRGSSQSPAATYASSVPPGFYGECIAAIEVLCWGVVFHRSTNQRLCTGNHTTHDSTGVEGTARYALPLRNALPETIDVFSHDAAKRREFVHSYCSLIGSLVSLTESLLQVITDNNNAYLQTNSNSEQQRLEGLVGIDIVVEWAGELIQDSVCLKDTSAASDLLHALIPVSSLSAISLQHVAKRAWSIMSQWAHDNHNGGIAASVPSEARQLSVPPRPQIGHRRTQSTTQKLEEAVESMVSLQSIARTTMGARHVANIEAYLSHPLQPGSREMAISSLRTIVAGRTNLSGEVESSSSSYTDEELRTFRALIPLLLRLIPSQDDEIRSFVAAAMTLILTDALRVVG